MAVCRCCNPRPTLGGAWGSRQPPTRVTALASYNEIPGGWMTWYPKPQSFTSSSTVLHSLPMVAWFQNEPAALAFENLLGDDAAG